MLWGGDNIFSFIGRLLEAVVIQIATEPVFPVYLVFLTFQIPPAQFIQWGRRLSSDRHNWAMVASKLRLLSREDVEYYQQNPNASGNGELVLNKWAGSELTYKDLTETLRSSDIRMDNLAAEIEGFFGTDV